MSDQPTSRPSDTRQNINDGPIDFDHYISMNRAALEVFFRSMLKPINDNETDAKGKNFIVEENFSFEPLKRLYFQDFYRSLLSTEKMYDMVRCDPVNDTWSNDGHTKTVVANSVKIQGHTEIGDLDTAINSTVGAMDAVEIDESHFHSTIEFTENASNRNAGLYDYGKLPGVNASGELFQLGLLEQVFKEEEELFKEDIRREHNIVSYQTIARRLTELFARLSNIRLSMLFWTDKANNYSKQWAVAALDIFYNLMSKLSEAHRINIPREYAGYETYTDWVKEKVITKVEDSRPLDVLLWIDCSGSMDPVIATVRKKLNELLTYVLKFNKDTKFGMIYKGYMSGMPATVCCNFTNNATYLQKVLASKIYDDDGKEVGHTSNESLSTLIDVMKGNVNYSSNCYYIWKDSKGNGKLQWEKDAKRMVIVLSDEPMDGYRSISSQLERHHHLVSDTQYDTDYDKINIVKNADGHIESYDYNPSGTRRKIQQYDNTTYTYYCLPKESGKYRTYNPADTNGPGSKWVVCPGRQTNNSFTCHETAVYFDCSNCGKTIHARINGTPWYKYKVKCKYCKTVNEGDARDAQRWDLNAKNSYSGNEFTRKDFVNAFINPGLSSNPTEVQIASAKDNVAELHWIFFRSETGTEDVCNTFKNLITKNILIPISRANDGNGAKITNTNKNTDFIKTFKNIFKNRSIYREEVHEQYVPVVKTRSIGGSLKDVSLKFARAARLNKTYADMMRPCVFVPNLVSTMMMIVQSRMVKTGKLPPETPHQDWTNPNKNGLLDKVIALDGGKFTWFGRTNIPSNTLFEKGLYVTSGQVNNDKLEALNQGGDYAESLTGIHLKLIDKPTGAGWSEGAEWTSDDIKKALTSGFEILADAFIECLNDGEVMKVLDMSTSPPTPTNLPELMKSKGKELGNVGDLQFSLILERIIAKVYKALNVKSCSYFRGNIPMLNMDFALRFLTDSTIKDKNELFKQDSTKYRKAYSNVVDYVNRVNEWKNSKRQLDEDTDYTLNNVVTTMSGDKRIVNPSFAHMLEEWSLCPYRFNESGSVVSNVGNSSAETKVGPTNSYGVSYSKKAPACPFAETVAPSAGEQGEPPCDRPHGCALHTFYEVPDTEVDGLVEKLELIPPNCPARALVNGILQQLHEQPQRIPYENSSQYIHALFKAVDENTNKLIDTKKEESKSMGYRSSSAIYEHITYPGETAPPSPPTYENEVHSNVRLVYLDQLIRLCQDLFRVNMDIAFEEPYLKTKIESINQHYYGTKDHGSFEPITCYRFSNFHALNDQDTRSASKGHYQLKYYARTLDPQWVTAVNRDLSGETSHKADSTWQRDEILDNERKIEGTTNIESEITYTSFNSYDNVTGTWPDYEKDGNKYTLTKEEILQGVIDPKHDRTSICRSNAHIHPFYQIHLMDEQSVSNQKQSLATFEVYVKRFRPIYLPNADDLFVSEDRDPLDPTNESVSIHATGWSMIPHKYSADAHLSKDAIIIPMNFGSRNSPRCGWFNELDYAFHKAVVQGDATAISGFYDEGADDITEKNIVGKEQDDIYKYHYRDWLWPAAMIGHCHVSGANGALAAIPETVEEIRIKDSDPKDGANDYTQGKLGNVTIQDFDILEDNLKHFDLFKCVDSNVGQSTALNANWLYITTPAPGGGVEISQCLFPLPWVFFHSSRGSQGAGPDNYCHGLGNRVTTDHEIGFEDGSRGMRFFAVNSVLAQNPVEMNLFGKSDVSKVYATTFIKGYYDPSCCGTDETWHTHGSNYYGWPNGGANKDGPRPDKYFLQYDNSGHNHVSAGQSLGSACVGTSYYQYGSNSIVESPFSKENSPIINTLKGKPMTWSMWNVLRQSLYWCYNKTDYDYNEERVGCAVNRTTIGASPEELEYKTGQSMRAMYKEWYQRFTYNGKYTSNAIGCNADTPWPYKTHDDDPANYGHAQKLMNGNGTAMSGETCKIEWTNLVADVSIIYNEVSDTHNSCLTFYTGGHPNYQMSHNYHDAAADEFKGPKGSEDSGVSSTQVNASWAGTNGYPNASNSIPFRYALSGIDMCRNFMALTYRGYNSPIPDRAYSGGYPKFEPHHSHPKELAVSREITTVNYNNNPISRSSSSADGTEFTDTSKLLRDIYPPTEENDTEGCDSNFLQRLLIPIYPNWEDLHDSNGNPIYPDAATDDDLKKIVFCVCPITYYDGLADGNDGGAQMGERMMAFCISQFFMGVEAEKLTSNLDTEFFAEIAKPNVSVIAPNLGHDYKPGDPAWGQGLVYAGNWDPSKWWRLS